MLIGHVRLGQDVVIRSLNGTRGVWYQGAVQSGHGVVDVDGRRFAVAFIPTSVGRRRSTRHAGQLTNEPVGTAVGIDSVDLAAVLA